GSQRQRTDPVLQRTRPDAVRTGGLVGGQEQGYGISEHAEECAYTGDRESESERGESVEFMYPGWQVLAGIALRTTVVYTVVLLGMRVSGKREIGQMTPFDLTLLLLLSNAVQNAMTGPDTSVLGGVVAAVTLLLMNFLVVEASGWNRSFRK